MTARSVCAIAALAVVAGTVHNTSAQIQWRSAGTPAPSSLVHLSPAQKLNALTGCEFSSRMLLGNPSFTAA